MLAVNSVQIFLLLSYLIFLAVSGSLLFAGADILMCLFILSTADMFLVMAASSDSSPFSTLGAGRAGQRGQQQIEDHTDSLHHTAPPITMHSMTAITPAETITDGRIRRRRPNSKRRYQLLRYGQTQSAGTSCSGTGARARRSC